MARFQAMRLVMFSPCTAYLVLYLLENGKNDWQLETGQVPAKGQERSQQRWRSKPRYNKHFDDCSWVQLTMWRLSTPTGEVCSIPNVFE